MPLNSRSTNSAGHSNKAPSRGVWYLSDQWRLLHEQDAMEQKHCHFILTRGDQGQLGWVGQLRSNRKNRYTVLVEYPDAFPYSPPKAYILKPSLTSQHMYAGGQLCIMDPSEGTWQPHTTAATIVGLVAAWIFTFENHRAKCRRGPNGAPCMDSRCPDWPGPKN